jgi:hypothetical protein
MQLCPLRCGPNGLMARFIAKNVVLTIRGVGIMVIIPSMAIFLCHVVLF